MVTAVDVSSPNAVRPAPATRKISASIVALYQCFACIIMVQPPLSTIRFLSCWAAVVDTSADPSLIQVNNCVPGPAKASMPKARCTGDAIGAVAERLFLESSFVTVGMDDLGRAPFWRHWALFRDWLSIAVSRSVTAFSISTY